MVDGFLVQLSRRRPTNSHTRMRFSKRCAFIDVGAMSERYTCNASSRLPIRYCSLASSLSIKQSSTAVDASCTDCRRRRQPSLRASSLSLSRARAATSIHIRFRFIVSLGSNTTSTQLLFVARCLWFLAAAAAAPRRRRDATTRRRETDKAIKR